MPRIADQLAATHVFIENVLSDPDVLARFSTAGRDAAYFTDARTRYQQAQALTSQRQAEAGGEAGATQALKAARTAAHTLYMRHLKLARLAFPDDARAIAGLRLRGDRARDLDGWLAQTTAFYTNALADDAFGAALAGFGVTAQALTDGQAAVAAVETARHAQLQERGEAQQATQDRNAALTALAAWYSENAALARVLFEDDPQRLEQLGLLARS